MRTMLFYRDFRRFTGGHLKIWDYFNHVRNAPDWQARIAFSAESVWDATNPWLPERANVLDLGLTPKVDAFFLGGTDWQTMWPQLQANPDAPVVNLIQHVVHADPSNSRFQYLKKRAIRICVSEDVRQSLADTMYANGPLYAIPNGLDLDALPAPATETERDIDLLIEGIKAQKLMQLILPKLKTHELRVRTIDAKIPRHDYLTLMNRARMTLFLPKTREGFYLPPLEGMALGTLVVCPDCEGNRAWCLDGVNCFRPMYKLNAIIDATNAALMLDARRRQELLDAAKITVASHDLHTERARFHEILSQCQELWRSSRESGS